MCKKNWYLLTRKPLFVLALCFFSIADLSAQADPSDSPKAGKRLVETLGAKNEPTTAGVTTELAGLVSLKVKSKVFDEAIKRWTDRETTCAGTVVYQYCVVVQGSCLTQPQENTTMQSPIEVIVTGGVPVKIPLASVTNYRIRDVKEGRIGIARLDRALRGGFRLDALEEIATHVGLPLSAHAEWLRVTLREQGCIEPKEKLKAFLLDEFPNPREIATVLQSREWKRRSEKRNQIDELVRNVIYQYPDLSPYPIPPICNIEVSSANLSPENEFRIDWTLYDVGGRVVGRNTLVLPLKRQ